MGISSSYKKFNRRSFLTASSTACVSSFLLLLGCPLRTEENTDYIVKTTFSPRAEQSLQELFACKHLWCEEGRISEIDSLFVFHGLLKEKILIARSASAVSIQRQFKNRYAYISYCKLIGDNNLISVTKARNLGLKIDVELPEIIAA